MAAAALLLLVAARTGAQDSLDNQPPTRATVRGRVVMPAGEKVIPLAGAEVTVHRVGPDAAGPLDSVRTGADGRYALSYSRWGSDRAVYFAAVVHRGIAYFSSPLQRGRSGEEEGEIVVFDTTSHRVPFSIQGHHVVVGAPGPDGSRTVVEVYELSNDTTMTVVGRDSVSAVWSASLPKGATGFAGGQGDVAPGALQARGDSVMVLAPFAPGVKQLSFSYSLPPSAFPLELTLARQTGVLEVLLEEVGAQARAHSLRTKGNATTQGRTFKRFLAEGAPAGERVRIEVPVVAASTRTRVLIGIAVVFVLAMAAALARALARRQGDARAVPRGPTPEGLLAAIAALDARHEAGDATLAPADYQSQRASLKRSLAEAMSRAPR